MEEQEINSQKFDEIFAKKLLKHAITSVDVENDYLYKKGFKKGREIALKKQTVDEEIEKMTEEPVKRLFDIEDDYFYKKGFEKGREIVLKEQIRDEEIEKMYKKSIIGLFKAGIDVKTTANALVKRN